MERRVYSAIENIVRASQASPEAEQERRRIAGAIPTGVVRPKGTNRKLLPSGFIANLETHKNSIGDPPLALATPPHMMNGWGARPLR